MSLSKVIPSRLLPRILSILMMGAALVALSGCWVVSLNPLYEEQLAKPDPDLTFDPELVGSWGHAGDDCLWLLTITAEERVYRVTSAPSSQCKKQEKPTRYQGRLVKLDNHVFLDLEPVEEDVCLPCMPLHMFFMTRLDKTSLILTPIDSAWFETSVKEGTVTLSTLPGENNSDVLTAPSHDLKAFVRKYAEDLSVFKPNPDFSYKKQ